MRRVLTTSRRRIALGRSLEVDFLSCPAASCNLLQRSPCCSASAVRQTAAAFLSQPLGDRGARGFAAEASDEGDEDPEIRDRSSAQVKKLAEQVMALSLLDVADLATILQERLGVTPQMLGGGGGGGGPAAAAPAAAPAAAAPAAEAKTEFDVKLTGFDAASKVKVIKEVRTMTSLGLKEAKELVEKAPTVVKTGLKKEEAEELQKKLEAVGGKVSLE